MDQMEFIRENQILSSASEKNQRLISEESQILTVRKNTYLFHDKELVSQLYFVIDGHFILYKLDNSGDKRIIFILGKESLLNDSLSPEVTASLSAKPLDEGVVLSISKDRMLDLMENDHDLTMAFLANMEHKIRRLHRQLKNTSGSIRMDKRLAAKLWKLSKDYGVKTNEGTLINLDLTHHFIADLIGTKRETISRQMRVLMDLGLIQMSGRQILIPSRKKLMEFFQGM